MILFKPEHVPMILDGRKTETRRLAQAGRRARWVVGGYHHCYTRPPFALGGSKPFALVRITKTPRVEPLGEITEAGAVAEGYASRAEYLKAFWRINPKGVQKMTREALDRGVILGDGWALPVWVVTFELAS